MNTKEKLEAIDAAIYELMTGKRVNSVSHGDMRVQYSGLSLDDLFNLRSRLLAGLDSSEHSKKRQVRFRYPVPH